VLSSNNNLLSKLCNQKGQSLFELLVALTIITLIVVSLIIVSLWSIKNSNYSRNKTNSSRTVQETIEWLRNERNIDWDSFYYHCQEAANICLTSLDWSTSKKAKCGDGDVITGTTFRRDVTFETVSKEEISIMVSLNWEDKEGLHTTRASTVLTKWNK
jgi:Tfp pilus assembly protein PilV